MKPIPIYGTYENMMKFLQREFDINNEKELFEALRAVEEQYDFSLLLSNINKTDVK